MLTFCNSQYNWTKLIQQTVEQLKVKLLPQKTLAKF